MVIKWESLTLWISLKAMHLSAYWPLAVTSSRSCSLRSLVASRVPASHGSTSPNPPLSRTPEEMHSRTLLNASPGLRGKEEEDMAFSTSTSIGHCFKAPHEESRLIKSFRILITITADGRFVARLWNHFARLSSANKAKIVGAQSIQWVIITNLFLCLLVTIFNHTTKRLLKIKNSQIIIADKSVEFMDDRLTTFKRKWKPHYKKSISANSLYLLVCSNFQQVHSRNQNGYRGEVLQHIVTCELRRNMLKTLETMIGKTVRAAIDRLLEKEDR